MFYNLRHVSIIVFFIASILTLTVVMYYKHAVQQKIIYSIVSKDAATYKESFEKYLYTPYLPLINSLATQQRNLTAESIPEYLMLQQGITNFFSAQNIVNVELYVNKTLLFQLHEMEFENTPSLLQPFLKKNFLEVQYDAMQDEIKNTIVNNVSIFDGISYNKYHTIRSVYQPHTTQLPPQYSNLVTKKLDTILVVYYNITPELKALAKLSYIMIILIVSALAIFTAVVFIMSIRAEKVIEEQHKANIEIETARKMAESESKAKSQFLANISHELRTPLNAIIGFSDIIKSESMGPIDNAQYKEFISDINTSGQHLLSLINDILDFSKAEEGKLEIEKEQIDITKMLSICIRMVMPKATQAGVNLIADIDKEHIILIADNKRMKQVILNLLSNALKFTATGGEVRVKCRGENDSVYIEIIDSGIGMEAQDLARALSPFGQVDSSLNKRNEGTGLGLPLTKKLI